MSDERPEPTPDERVVLESVKLSAALSEAAHKVMNRLQYINDMDAKELLTTAKAISELSKSVASNHATVIKNTISLRDSYLKREALQALRGGAKTNARFPQPPPLPTISVNNVKNEQATKEKQNSLQDIEIVVRQSDRDYQGAGEQVV